MRPDLGVALQRDTDQADQRRKHNRRQRQNKGGGGDLRGIAA